MTHDPDTLNNNPSKDRSTLVFGWSCTLLHDFPEPEGIVFFSGKPRPGLKFKLPSSGYREEWEVQSVNEDDMSFTAVKPESLQTI